MKGGRTQAAFVSLCDVHMLFLLSFLHVRGLRVVSYAIRYYRYCLCTHQ